MSWRKVVESDLTASLAQNEIDAFRKSSFDGDPVESQIASIVAYVRGCIRSGGAVALSDDPDALPESLISPAMDYLRYQILTRMNVAVNESRTRAWEKANELFYDVRRGAYIVESPAGESSGAGKAATPLAGSTNPSRLLD